MSSKKINKSVLYIVDLVIIAICTGLDRLTKFYAVTRLKNHPSVSVWSGVFELHYLENYGAAFGILKNQKYFFVLVTGAVVLTCIYVLVKMPARKKYNAAHILLTLIMAGAVGNVIDRFLYGYVVDFLYITIIDFPIFNIADIFVTVSTIVLVFLLIFYYKEDDFNFLTFMEKKLRDIS